MRWLIALVFLPAASMAADPEPNCEKPATTYDFNICGSRDVEKARAEMQRYFEAAKVRMRSEGPLALTALEGAQSAWTSYQEKHCAAIYARWQGGTIRGPASVQCSLDLTRQRTHELWANYLTYPDSTPPVLPEPQK
jgi:uncharacterized protein YecT (DUF1311 family)